ncbi:hypothetical protein BU26DRAFT_566852 [Trematosphaeria pertusa]|uniref:Uncharacterized protein n=1 Tax=Trematosphaeria pertusa TaxID=390896 RepID=A0A6A6I8S3_9PLEO|nr:uncharacterized protein BU26DRAFT_566852 [Trematosphaeria pertusa]KAF2246478.1 hypothetical protein BU26DRAFT_566852 [Trematosphaeria pertusa]
MSSQPSHDPSPRAMSVERSPTYLNLSSRFHDEFPPGAKPHVSPSLRSPNSRRAPFRNAFTSVFQFFQYSQATEDERQDDGEKYDERSYERKSKFRHVRWGDSQATRANRWFAVAFLMLLLSLQSNVFLVFNCPPNSFLRYVRGKKDLCIA